jgi:hypothetical protein
LVTYRSTIGGPFSGSALNTENISQSLQGATGAEVQISPAVAILRVGSTQTMNRSDFPPDLLIIGTVSMGRDERVTRDFQVNGNTARFVLRTDGFPFFPFVGSPADRAWDLNLTPNAHLSLQFSSGVGDSQIDLTGLNVTQFDDSVGVGRAIVTLPAHGKFQAHISGGVGDVTVRIPSGLAARIHLSTGLGATDISTVYERQGDFYVSSGYDTAVDRVDLSVSGGIGKVTVQQLSQ